MLHTIVYNIVIEVYASVYVYSIQIIKTHLENVLSILPILMPGAKSAKSVSAGVRRCVSYPLTVSANFLKCSVFEYNIACKLVLNIAVMIVTI